MARAGVAEENRRKRAAAADVANARVTDARSKLLESKMAAVDAGDVASEVLLSVAIDVVNRVFVKVK